VVIQTPFGKLLMMISDALRGEYKGVFKDPSQWLFVSVNAPYLPREWNLECVAQGYLYGIPDRPGT
jgi:hypothetical protein